MWRKGGSYPYSHTKPLLHQRVRPAAFQRTLIGRARLKAHQIGGDIWIAFFAAAASNESFDREAHDDVGGGDVVALSLSP